MNKKTTVATGMPVKQLWCTVGNQLITPNLHRLRPQTGKLWSVSEWLREDFIEYKPDFKIV